MFQRESPVKKAEKPLPNQFIKAGFEGLNGQEIVQLLLCPSCSCHECKKWSKECIKQFKNLRGIMQASPQELARVGISPYGIFCIQLMYEIPKEYLKEKIVGKSLYKSSKEVFDYLYYSMQDLKKEVFKVLYLNHRNQIINIKDLFEGTLESAPIRPREIVESAIKRKASTMIFVHNHPSGDVTPSQSDKQLTRDLVFIGNILQIKVVDHIIIGENQYFSFADEGLIEKYDDHFLNLKIKGVFDYKA